MYNIDIGFVKNKLAANQTIFARAENLYLLGKCQLVESRLRQGEFAYVVSGSSREYKVTIILNPKSGIKSTKCTCPYPHDGCKHVVAACLDLARRIQEQRLTELPRSGDGFSRMAQNDGNRLSSKGRAHKTIAPIPASAEALMEKAEQSGTSPLSPYLSPAEIRSQALQSRIERSSSESFQLITGDTYVGVHQVRHLPDEPYTITVYDPVKRLAHCTCPDYAVNNLMTCKHLIFAFEQLDKRFDVKKKQQMGGQREEDLPFVHLTWNSLIRKPVCHMPLSVDPALTALLSPMFDERGEYRLSSLVPLFDLYRQQGIAKVEATESSGTDENGTGVENIKIPFRFDQRLLDKIDEVFFEEQVSTLEKNHPADVPFLKIDVYPYQREGIRFAAFRRSAILADEMGLGKTVQAIAAACIKKDVFGITSVLIICPASLKRQWKQEIEKFTDYTALLLEGSPSWRRHMIIRDKSFFKIINYEMVMRDLDAIKLQPPDLVILDEAQRIKNFTTKTHKAIKQIPRSHSLVLTGTPLENKLEDLYSIVQFCNPELLAPLWAFAAQHYRMSRERGNKILGYHNLDLVHEKMKPLLLRRTKAEVFDSLPEITQSRISLEPTEKQMRHHQTCLQSLQRIIRKKVLTPMDMQRMQQLLLSMRMVCDAACLVDDTIKDTSSPKLEELESLLRDVVVEGRRKVIVFSEWTSMTALVGTVVSNLGLDFVEFTGKVPVKKRQILIDEFRNNPACMVFIASDAGSVGLNLQNCDFLVNMELPWNPAKLNQRIGRIHRIGQKSNKVHVVNMVMTHTIEEKIAIGLNLKQDLFDAVFSGNANEVDFGREGRSQFVNQLNALVEAMKSPTDYVVVTKPELDETDPHYLNPHLLEDDGHEDALETQAEQAAEVDLAQEYSAEDLMAKDSTEGASEALLQDSPAVSKGKDESHAQSNPVETKAAPPREQLQAVLNQGLAFLNSLAQMSTGKALFAPGTSNPIEIDPKTGEVVMRFKLE